MKYQEDLIQGKESLERNGKWVRKLKSKKRRDLDDSFHQAHEEVFQDIDCLQCANCCKTTSPIFIMTDIERLAKTLKMKIPDFIHQYLTIDEDGDYVLQSAPCPFLRNDNYCSVYDARPRACREYPHTQRKRMHQILDLTLRNSLICPAVSRMFEQLVKT